MLRKVVAGILLAAALAIAAASFLVPRLLNLDNYRPQILSMAQSALNRRVSYESASFSWRLTPSFDIRGITISEKSGDATFAKIDRLSFELAIIPLLRKEVRLRDIVIEHPVLALDRDQAGVFNIEDLLAGKPSPYKTHLSSLRISNGQVRFSDRRVDPQGFAASLENLNLYVKGLDRGEISHFTLSVTVPDEEGGTAASIAGTVRIPAQGVPLSDAKFNVSLKARNVNAGRYWPYYGRRLPFEPVRGHLDIDEVFKGTSSEFSTKGELRIRGLRFQYPRVFHATLTPKEVRLEHEIECAPGNFLVKSLDLNVDGLRVTGSFALDGIQTSDPHISARAVTSPFRLEEFRQYIPYGVIVKGTADFIEQHVTGGVYRLDEGRLDGRASQILHMERDDNYNALFILGHVERGVVTFGPRIPTFTDIKGELEMRGKDFLLRRMTGTFGSSPFTLEGKIADYALATPASYPFTMEISPGGAEVAWLLRQERSAGFAFGGKSLLRLSGSGNADDYRLAGSWDLSAADYRYRQTIRKPAGTANRLQFGARLGRREARLENLRYELPPITVTASATYRYTGKEPLTFAVASNWFKVDPLLFCIPGLREYHPSGRVQAVINGTGNPDGSTGIALRGLISVDGFSARPFEQLKPLSAVTGTVRLTETSLETDGLSGTMGNSAFTMKGRVTGPANPAVDLALTSPALHPEDIGIHAPGKTPEVKNLSGSFSLKGKALTISSLSGEVLSSAFALSGEIPDIGTPKITLRIDFPHVRLEDMEQLAGFTRAGGGGKRPAGISLTVHLTSTAGTARDIPFEHLDSDLTLENGRLDLRSVHVGIFGGTVSGRGKADFSGERGRSYQGQYRFDGVNSARLLSAVGAKPTLTGELAAEGDFSARGDTVDDLEKSIVTSATLHLRDGEVVIPSPAGGSVGERIPYRVVDAKLALKGQTLTIRDLKAGMFGGTVSGSGVADFTAPEWPTYRAHYRLERVDAGRLLRTATMKPQITGQLDAEGDISFSGNTSETMGNTVKGSADIRLADGVIRFPASEQLKRDHDFPYKSLQAHVRLEDRVLTIDSARIEAFSGQISANAVADYSAPDDPAFRLDCQLTKIDSDSFFDAFDATRDLTGSLTLRGEFTARGSGATEMKKTLQGSTSLHLEKGVVRKFGFISKVFSLLNVSQLLDFRLPDMITTGMTYDTIDGTFTCKEGKFTTKDLTMHSPSLNMTVVGDADVVRRELDLKIGVQPFQTVGKVVTKIPVLGWILTGGKKRFLVVYYEAKGSFDDPKVSTLPETAITSGIYNIFKRALNLPEKMITNPGKVIMGQ